MAKKTSADSHIGESAALAASAAGGKPRGKGKPKAKKGRGAAFEVECHRDSHTRGDAILVICRGSHIEYQASLASAGLKAHIVSSSGVELKKNKKGGFTLKVK